MQRKQQLQQAGAGRLRAGKWREKLANNTSVAKRDTKTKHKKKEQKKKQRIQNAINSKCNIYVCMFVFMQVVWSEQQVARP